MQGRPAKRGGWRPEVALVVVVQPKRGGEKIEKERELEMEEAGVRAKEARGGSRRGSARAGGTLGSWPWCWLPMAKERRRVS